MSTKEQQREWKRNQNNKKKRKQWLINQLQKNEVERKKTRR